MKRFDRILTAAIIIMILLLIGANTALSATVRNNGNKYHLVEVSRLCRQLENGESPDLSDCRYVTAIESYMGNSDFFNVGNSYVIREINGTLYRFDYISGTENIRRIRILITASVLIPGILFLIIMLYLRHQLIKPFHNLVNVPYELSKGNLTTPLEENKNRFFGRFVWGIDMLRETMESQKQHELSLQKEKQTLLLSISHDIKTPLSAIKLYASALFKGLYKEEDKQREIALCINKKADEIERFVSELSRTAGSDFLRFELNMGEFYLSEAVKSISQYYSEKLALNKTHFAIEDFTDCIVTGDLDRSIEVLQNIMENAIKYGDGKEIRISFSSEETGRLVTITNSGSILPEAELVHVFDSFWRGSNSRNKTGSGLGLYICRQLMIKMNGDIFATINGDEFSVTVVFHIA